MVCSRYPSIEGNHQINFSTLFSHEVIRINWGICFKISTKYAAKQFLSTKASTVIFLQSRSLFRFLLPFWLTNGVCLTSQLAVMSLANLILLQSPVLNSHLLSSAAFACSLILMSP